MVEDRTQLQRYLQLGRDLSATAEELAKRASILMIERSIVQPLRGRALTGLALKIDASFEALLDDAEKQRGEAMHHLKTMMESYIYFRAIAADASDRTAERVLAEAWDLKARMLTASGDENQGLEARRRRDELLQGERVTRHRVDQLAQEQGMESWYWNIYRMACEPAHLGDLPAFMPLPAGVGVEIGGDAMAAYVRAVIAVHDGITVMLAMFDEFNHRNELGLRVPIDDFRKRQQAIN